MFKNSELQINGIYLINFLYGINYAYEYNSGIFAKFLSEIC